MAAIHNYTITFMPLRAAAGDSPYVVNIGGGSGYAVPLNGAAQPFVTDENDEADEFALVRTQSGYLRIVDDGLDANGNSWDWRDLIPDTDTSRPVTLTRGGTVMWQGFMQAQNFGSTLYGDPQEREFPVQCSLSVTQGFDINYQEKAVHNFAYLLKTIIDCIPSAAKPQTFVFQGGNHALAWLQKKIDWQNFVSEDDDGLTARYNLYQCLEDMCRFWGWTARTWRQTVYFTCADDADEQTFIALSYSNLSTLAGGSSVTVTEENFSTCVLSGDIFANADLDDYQQRGPNKATVTGNANQADKELVYFADKQMVKEMKDGGWQSAIHIDEKTLQYTVDKLSFNRPFQNLRAVSGKGAFNVAKIYTSSFNSDGSEMAVIRILDAYNGNGYVMLESTYEHAFDEGLFKLYGNIYRKTEKFEDVADEDFGNYGKKNMYVRFGIGADRNSCQWYNGSTWQSQITDFKVTIGNSDDHFCIRTQVGGLSYITGSIEPPVGGVIGKVFIDLLGTDEYFENPVLYPGTNKTFEIEGFKLEFERNNVRVTGGSGQWQGAGQWQKIDLNDRKTYKSKNGNGVIDDFATDNIYASDNDMSFGYGVIIDGSGYMGGLLYGSSTTPEFAEQHLANRVTSYWQTTKRMLRLPLRSNLSIDGTAVNDITPQFKVTADGTVCHPIGISHDWRDDVTTLTLLEL
jgi:hypothetical protein